MNDFSMMHVEEWTERDTALLAPAMADDPLYGLEHLKADHAAGHVSLLRLIDTWTDEHYGSLCVRIDCAPLGNELVIVADGAKMPAGASAYKIGSKLLIPYAKAMGCRFLRGHTSRTGIARLMQRAGFKHAETVMRMEIN